MRWSLAYLVLTLCLTAREFSVAVYNVENLFDADGRAAYREYQPEKYSPSHLRTKLNNIAELVARMETGGPDILFLQELETDQSPGALFEPRDLVKPWLGRSLADLFKEPLEPALADLPSEAWLLLALEARGLKGYTVVAGSDATEKAHEDGNLRAIKNVVFTRFPPKEVRNHPVTNARNILEVVVEAGARPLHLFANHWKSGAGSVQQEQIRLQNAGVLRNRLDEILAADPLADVLIAGDLNSQYNQRERYPEMKHTAIQDVLRSQGDETALATGTADLYNLWYELPPGERRSDVYRDEWGTLMHLIVSRGLYEGQGTVYLEGSFKVVALPGLNMNAEGLPNRWVFKEPAGYGFSDHFPVLARFKAGETSPGWLELVAPSKGETPKEALHVDRSAERIAKEAPRQWTLPPKTSLREGTWEGRPLVVRTKVLGLGRLSVEMEGEVWEVYAPDPVLLRKMKETWKQGEEKVFLGEIGQYKGRWQLVVRHPSWLEVKE